MSTCRELIRRKIAEEIYEKLSPEDKRTFVQLTLQDRNWNELFQALKNQNAKLDDVSQRIGSHPFASDLLANVSGNFITDGLVWLGTRIFRKL